ncbi:MAG: DUF4893 domain-containing protein [Sphingobium sp.]
MQRLLPLLAAVLALPACTATSTRPASIASVAEPGWRALVTPQDEQRLMQLPGEWRALLASVPSRLKAQLLREGDLLVPDAGRDHPTPPPGSYRCRMIKLTMPAKPGTGTQIKTFPDYFCYIRGEENNALSFTKQTGTELPRGWLYSDGDRRLMLVGAQQREAGDFSLDYGSQPDRDVVGIMDRVGPFRWRLAIAGRTAAQGIDIYELTPVPLKQQAEEPRVATPAVTVSGASHRDDRRTP